MEINNMTCREEDRKEMQDQRVIAISSLYIYGIVKE